MHSISTQGNIACAMSLIGEAGKDVAAFFGHLLSGLQCVMLAGDKLNEAKNLVDHGERLTCLRENGQFSDRTAQKYMRAADLRKEIEDQMRRGNSHLTLDQMLALFATKKPTNPKSANQRVGHNKSNALSKKVGEGGDSNGDGVKSTPTTPLSAPCKTTGDVAQNSEDPTVDAATPAMPGEITEPSAASPLDQPLAIDQVDEHKQDHEPQASSELVIDVESVPSAHSPAAVSLADRFAQQFRVNGQEGIALAMAVERIVALAREAIADEASRISEKSGFIHYEWSPKLLAAVITTRVAAALNSDS